MAEASAAPILPTFQESGVSVEELAGKGRGAVSKRAYKEFDTIFAEVPLMSCQFAWNREYKYLACEFCLRSLETAQDMAIRLANNPGIELPLTSECCESRPETYVSCDGCGVLYCSANCLEMAREQYHLGVCAGRMDAHRRELFDKMMETWRGMHFPPETTSIELLARFFSTSPDSPYGIHLFSQLEALVHGTMSEDESLVHKLLHPAYAPQIDEIHQCLLALYGDGERNCTWLTGDRFRALLSLLGRNQQGIGSSAYSRYVHNFQKCDLVKGTEKMNMGDTVDEVYDLMQEVSGPFLDVEGVGIYEHQSRLNHSCSPNVEVCFVSGDHTLSIVALEDINVGEELCISYLDECMRSRSRHSRQKHLRENYLFTCTCPLCIAQQDDEDVTSEEEDDDDEEEEEET